MEDQDRLAGPGGFETVLAKATEDVTPIAGKLPPETLEKLREIAQDPTKAEKLFDYLMGRSFKANPGGWVIQSIHWALDLGIPDAVVNAAFERKQKPVNEA